MSNRNGYRSSKRAIFSEGCEDSPTVSQENSSKTTSPFRGFPIVAVQRMSLDKLLEYCDKKMIKQSPSKSLQPGKNSHRKFRNNCSVKLVREDLDKLKTEVTINSRVNKKKRNLKATKSVLYCKVCEKAYSNENSLKRHMECRHLLFYKEGQRKPPKRVSFSDQVIVHELTNDHRCRKCTMVFDNYRLLERHLKRKHKKRRRYICHYCSKKFINRGLFKEHIKLHCDVCGVLSPNKKIHQYHRRYTCGVLKKYKCRTCNESYFSYMDLKDHSYDHLENLFICDICKDQMPSKCAISHHLAFLHSNVRPRSLYVKRNLRNEKMYLCNFCNESTVDRNLIREHVASLPNLRNRTLTGYNDYYFCDQCLMKFNTETRMLQHKWSHYLPLSNDSLVNNKYLSKPQLEYDKSDSDNSSTEKNSILYSLLKESEPISTLITGDKLQVQDNVPSKFDNPLINTDNSLPKQNYILTVSESLDCETDQKTKQDILSSTCYERTQENRKSLSRKPHLDIKKTYNVNGKLPDFMKPRIILNKLDLNKHLSTTVTDVNNDRKASLKTDLDDLVKLRVMASVNSLELGTKRAIVDPISKKTLISKYQCAKCSKYYSSSFCLNRHIETVHNDYTNLQCKVCKEIFGWPSHLQRHRCFQANIPEIPYDDALNDLLNVSDGVDYTNSVDFEIPTPIVELVEYDDCVNVTQDNIAQNNIIQNTYVSVNGYRIVVQEVPVEF